MKILLTGGCGFIGSNLLKHLILIPEIDSIVVLDNMSTGNLANISNYLDNKKIKFISGDIRNINTCYECLSQVNIVLHQAALGSVPRSIENPIDSHDTNINGFLNILYASKEIGVEKFIFAASSSTYGDSLSIPKVENSIGMPLSPYALTKYVNELYAEIFYKCYGLKFIGLRYFNVFGPYQDPNSSYSAVIPKFCKNILNGENILINGDGSIARDFTYIDNVIQANILSIFTDNNDSINQIYNVACGEMYSIKFLAEELIKISGRKIKIINGPNRKGDIQFSKASIEKIKSNLGYNPSVSFEEGLIRTWNFYKEQYSNK